MKRRPMPELLDTDAGSPAEVAASIQDLHWFNRWFGGLPTTHDLLLRAGCTAGKNKITVLDIAAADGYVLDATGRDLRREGIDVDFTLLDRSLSHLPRNGGRPKVAADALKLPFLDASFDFVFSSLFVHHLGPADVVAFAKEAFRVARVGLLIHDLIRNPVHLAFAYAGLPLYRSRITRNDAPASVWQAYTVAEMKDLLQQAGAGEIQVRSHFLYRMGLLARKPQ